MSDITDGLGSAVEGALVGRTVEPDTGAHPSQLRKGACLNCGTTLTGAHCTDCGQKAQIHRSLKTIGHDLMHGVLHLDGKLWRTLPLLAWKPGELTRRYIEGERAKFVSPMAMFLFSVFLMFAVFQALGISTPTTLEGADVQVEENMTTAVSEAQKKIEEELESSRAQLAALPDGDERRSAIEATIAEQVKLTGTIKQAEAIAREAENGEYEFSGTGIKWIDEGLIEKWSQNPGLMLYKLQTNSYKFSWLLIPISIPFVWSLFFWKRRFKAYDHAIFVTYSLSFMSLLFVTLSVIGMMGAPPQVFILAGIFIPLIHIHRQLKGAYSLSMHGAFWRTCALSNMIVFGILTIFLWLLLLLGAF